MGVNVLIERGLEAKRVFEGAESARAAARRRANLGTMSNSIDTRSAIETYIMIAGMKNGYWGMRRCEQMRRVCREEGALNQKS